MLDKMLAQMLGIEPEEMNEMLSGMQTMLKDGVHLLNTINEKLDRVLVILEKETDDGK